MNMLSRMADKLRAEGPAGVYRAARNRLVMALGPHPIAGALARLEAVPEATVVQVGAHVGPASNDPLHGFLRRKAGRGLRAILVEPVAEHHAKLEAAYRDLTGVECVHAAVAEAEGTATFYRLGVDPRDHGMPDWLEQLGSLRADRMTDRWDHYEAIPEYQDFYLRHRVAEPVRCVTLAGLLRERGVGRLDLLQIDAEGYDGKILLSIDFDQTRPTFINYERVLMTPAEESEVRAKLRRAGYRLKDYGQDTFCELRAGASGHALPNAGPS